MAQILVQLSDQILRQLDKVAPPKSRKRSRFIRLAIQKAIMDLQDLATREAYRRAAGDEPAWFEARSWDEWKPQARRVGARSRK